MTRNAKRKKRYSQRQRDARDITKPVHISVPIDRLLSEIRRINTARRLKSDPIEDKRRYQPTSQPRRYMQKDGRIAQLRMRRDRRKMRPSDPPLEHPGFADPKRVEICGKRRDRREALFALGKAGHGKKGPKYRKYNEDSKVRC